MSSKLNDVLVAYYPFNGNANDESGNGNDGTNNGATLSTDRFGNLTVLISLMVLAISWNNINLNNPSYTCWNAFSF